MQYLSLFTPAVRPSGPPNPEHMAQMMKLIDEMTQKGVLVSTGPIAMAEKCLRVTARNGNVEVKKDLAGDPVALTAGYAILQADSEEQLIEGVKMFLNAVGDGECKVLPIPMPPR
ncbi:MAG TPA: hypothetical protein VH000_08260 [Rhizomicrobium sp.]|jgi:hypothetical protein|nr:hypothetical protein [Rhizomicrobium sp.]